MKNKEFSLKTKKPHKILAFLITIGIIIGIGFTTFANQIDVSPNILLGKSSGKLGKSQGQLGASSTEEIHTVDDLIALSKRVAGGDSCKGVWFQLKTNIDFSEVEDWEPIGTKSSPFKGIFDGGNFTITGLGTSKALTLFGTIEDAVIQNLTIQLPSSDAFSGLAQYIINSTIEGVEIIQGASISARSMLSVVGDKGWHTPSANPTTYEISTAKELLGLLQIVNDGVDSFDTHTIEITSDIDLSSLGINWEGIGTSKNPFQGTFKGKTGIVKINGLKVDLPGMPSLGLFGSTKGATIEYIDIVDAIVKGGEGVGIIVGVMEDTVLRYNATSGSVSGSSYVGGLVGDIIITSTASIPQNTVEWSYSTANVSATTSVGGLVGRFNAPTNTRIENSFATGNVVGVISVGGVLGSVEGNLGSLNYVASSGTVSGAGLTGGILGSGAGGLYVIDSYTTSTVSAFSDSGGILGGRGSITRSYTSGHMVSPTADSDNYIYSSWGYDGSESNTYAEYNTTYRTDNFMNEDASRPNAFKRKNYGTSFLNDNPTTPSDLTAFENGNLIYNTDTTAPQNEQIAISGTYPQLISFNDPAAPEAYKYFTLLTTDVGARNISSRLYSSNESGYLSSTPNGAPMEIPTLQGIVWKINNKTDKIVLEDATLKNGNIVALEDSTGGSSVKKITTTAPINIEENIVISAEVPSLKGFGVKHTVSLKDQDLRTLYNSDPHVFYDSIAEAKKPTSNYVSNIDNMHYYEFNEPVILNPALGGEIDIYEYDDSEFSNPPTATGKAKVHIINNTVLEIAWERDFVHGDRGYFIDLEGLAVVEDEAHNIYNKKLYFRSEKILPVSISFSKNDLAESGSTPQHQILKMVERDSSFGPRSMFEGIDVGPKQYKDFQMTISDLSNWQAVKSAQGKGPYKDLTATKDNFYLIPGEYELTYEMLHPTEPTDQSLKSNKLKRTYLVVGDINVELNGKKASPIVTSISQEDVIEWYEKEPNMNQLVNKYLQDRYLNPDGKNYLEAFQYDTDGEKVSKKITFITDGIPENSLTSGFQGIVYYEVEDRTELDDDNKLKLIRTPMVISLEGIMPQKEIIVRGDTYYTDNMLSHGEAIRHFDAIVVNKSDPLTPLDDVIYYDWSEIDEYRYDLPQTVTLYIKDGYQETISGVDMTVSSTATVVVKKVKRLVIDEEVYEDRDESRYEYWDNKTNIVRKGEANRIHNFDIEAFDGGKAPSDFFKVLANQKNATVNLSYNNGILLTMKTKNIDKEAIPADMQFYDLNIEEMHSLYVKRDTNGMAVQQFHTDGKYKIPGLFTVSMPRDAYLPSKNLKLFTIDEKTNRYVFIRNVRSKEITEDRLTFDLTEYYGEFIITQADLDGLVSSRPIVNSSKIAQSDLVTTRAPEKTPEERNDKIVAAEPKK